MITDSSSISASASRRGVIEVVGKMRRVRARTARRSSATACPAANAVTSAEKEGTEEIIDDIRNLLFYASDRNERSLHGDVREPEIDRKEPGVDSQGGTATTKHHAPVPGPT